ncbi:MAG: hypothetical protein ABJN69_04405 [Hellea sp.]
MTEDSVLKPGNRKRDTWLGIMASVAIAWYFFNMTVFIMTIVMSDSAILGLYEAEQITYLMETPFWAKMANAVSVLAGLIGSAYLLLRRNSAYYWFMLCLVNLLILLLDAALRGGFQIMGPSLLGVSAASFIVGIYLFWAAYLAHDGGELNEE